MKKAIFLLLVLVMCLSLCACGSGTDIQQNMDTPSAGGSAQVQGDKDSEVWSLEFSTDDFGDVTEDSVPFLANIAQGSFSNSATGGSDLTVVTSFMKSLDITIISLSLISKSIMTTAQPFMSMIRLLSRLRSVNKLFLISWQ